MLMRRPFSSLLAIATALTATIGWECSVPPDVPPQEHASAAIAADPKAGLSLAGGREQRARAAPALTEIALSRPLFSVDRRPAREVAASAVITDPAPPRLTGVIVGPLGRAAIFASPATAAPPNSSLVAREGEQVGPWTVRLIAAGEVAVSGPGGDLTLQPSFSGAPPPARPRPTTAGADGEVLQLPTTSLGMRPWR